MGEALENFRRVRRLEIRTRKLVNEVFSGEYHSVFRGRGIEFAEVREYQPGDDVRSIDWNVTARSGRPFVKQYQEERELTVVFVVDVSGSLGFGTRESTKAELATRICAVLALSALQNHDKLGLMLFSDRVEQFLRPRKGRAHALRIIREIQGARATGRPTRMEGPLEQLRRVVKRRAVVFLVSDFLGGLPVKELALLNRRHDMIALRIQDPAELEFPAEGLVELVDAETGARGLVNTSGARVRRQFHADQVKRLETGRAALARAGVETVTLTTGQSFVEPLMAFFERRAR
ncbi:MAG: DUF58 domain-containing protein [Candidatus Eisenbacteria bacterium]|nr:DUF58 domain-containing protein [Candidatus Eisenbacteria bacterium]